jgi:hypothetical protein
LQTDKSFADETRPLFGLLLNITIEEKFITVLVTGAGAGFGYEVSWIYEMKGCYCPFSVGRHSGLVIKSNVNG